MLDVYTNGTRVLHFMRFTEFFEDRRYGVYSDSQGNRTVGVGFNMEGGARAVWEAVLPDVSFDAVRDGRLKLNDQQVDMLFLHTMLPAYKDASAWIRNFDEHPKIVQKIIVDMRFNLGGGGIREFVKFRAALHALDYCEAAKEMKDSDWYRQVRRRSKHHHRKMLEVDEKSRTAGDAE